jgi:S-disulfanyl-L-cysteine oxidoreductase SoxD
MHRGFLAIACALAALSAARTTAQTTSTPLGIGRSATAEDIRALDVDVMPDGRGLPAGRGTAVAGAAVYEAKCASCHGVKGAGGSAERLAGRTSVDSFAFATDASLVRTIGSYWPYATTLYDYTSRAMPFPQPGTLTPDETYSLVAYLLFLNGVIAEDAIMDQSSLPKVRMPARDRFVPDNRRGGRVVK